METHELQLRRLDDYDLAPDVIKADVQGLEEQVIRGGLHTIRTHRPCLILETPDPSLIRLLGELGYEAMEYIGHRLQPMSGRDINVIFVPDQASPT